MIYEKINLDPSDEKAYLEVFAPGKCGDFVRDAILVIPGGGYRIVCASREGEPIAQGFIPHGFSAFVLHYSVGKKPFPHQLIQASKAMKYIKDNAHKYNINPDRVFTVGFSAGGHLAASLGTLWHLDEIYREVQMDYGYNKPAGMMLIYPVISYEHHPYSLNNLFLKESLSDAEKEICSIEKHIDEKTSPAFILHTSNDEVVNIKNSLVLADAMAEKNLKFEMHIYPDAPHGLALGNEITSCGNEKWCNPAFDKWIENACLWAKNI